MGSTLCIQAASTRGPEILFDLGVCGSNRVLIYLTGYWPRDKDRFLWLLPPFSSQSTRCHFL